MVIDYGSGFNTAPTPGDTLGQQKSGAVTPTTFTDFIGGASGDALLATQTPNDQPAFELAFGFIPTLNVGNILGIDNDVARTITNIVADPFAWLPAIFSGGLTMGARAATAATRLNSTKRLLSAVGMGKKVIPTAKGRLSSSLSSITKAKKALEGGVHAAHADPALLNLALDAAKANKPKEFVTHMRKILKADLPADVKQALNVRLDDLGHFADLAKFEEKLRKQKKFLNMDEGAREVAIRNILDDKFLQTKRVSQLEAGQRSLLRIKLPFSVEDGVPIKYLHGRKLYTALDAIKPLKLRRVAGGTTAAFMTNSFLNKSDEVLKANKLTDEAIASWRAEVEAANPGALGQGMDDLMKFYIEGKGVPRSELERLDLLDSVVVDHLDDARFHGTSVKIEALGDASKHFNDQNIYGQGFYTTSSKEIAKGYTKKGSGHEQHIYAVTPKPNLKILDMEQTLDKLDPKLLATLNNSVGDRFDEAGTLTDLVAEMVYGTKRHRELGDHWFSEASFADVVREFGSKIKVRDLYDTPRREMRELFGDAQTMQEVLFIPFQEAFQRYGYDGMSHVGGKLTGRKAHDVRIYWDPAKSLTLRKMGKTGDKLLKGDEFKKFSSKTTKAGEITGRQQNIDILSQRDFDKFLADKGWKKSMDSTKKHIENHQEMLRIQFNEAQDVFGKAINPGNDLPELQKYISHMWKLTPEQELLEAKRLKTSGAMLNKRKFHSYIEGMNNKYVPKHESTFDLVRAYQREMTEIIENRKIIGSLANPKNKVWIDGQQVSLFSSEAQLRKLGVDLSDFVDMSKQGDDALRFLHKVGVMPRAVKGKAVKTLGKPFVPRQVADHMKLLYGRKSTAAAAKGLDNFNALSKLTSLSFSLFHAGALTETALATMKGKGLVESAKRGFGIPVVNQLLKKAGVHSDIADDVVDGWRADGLVTGAASDAQRGVLDNMFDAAEKKLGRFGALARGGKKFSDIVNNALWNNFHEPLKLINAEHQLLKLKKNPAFNFLPEKELRRRAAAMSNDAFGGQNWALLGVDPKMKQMLHWALLAPDWTISNLRVAGGNTGIKGLARGVIGMGRNPTESMVGSYWRTAIPTMYGAMTLLNRSLSGHWMHENAPGKTLEVDLGTKNEKGQPEYMKLGKQMREPFRWLTDPLSIGGGKLSPGVREVTEQLTGHSPGQGYPTAFASDYHKKPLTFVEQIPARLKNVGIKFVPFSIQGNNVLLAFPKSGLTPFKVENTLIELAGRGKIDDLLRATGVKDSRAEDIRVLLSVARGAGMDVNRILGNVRRKTQGEDK